MRKENEKKSASKNWLLFTWKRSYRFLLMVAELIVCLKILSEMKI